ncbi:PrsW family glutamic-type intramembrane protease, partial [Streptococcus salivarius]
VSTLSISFINDLESAIVAPLVEEPLKLIGVAFALYLVPVKNLKSILLLGIVAGFGFQISEDFSYILSDMSEGFSFAISGILGRVVGSI